MAKTKYTVRFNGTVVDTRKSDRVYTHAVVAFNSLKTAERWAVKNWMSVDRDNYDYFVGIINGTGKSYGTTAEEAVEKLQGAVSFEAYRAIMVTERQAEVEKRKAEGYYTKPIVMGYCGRLDLAQKLLSTTSNNDHVEDAVIVPVEAP